MHRVQAAVVQASVVLVLVAPVVPREATALDKVVRG
jgi:hypothetical protein